MRTSVTGNVHIRGIAAVLLIAGGIEAGIVSYQGLDSAHLSYGVVVTDSVCDTVKLEAQVGLGGPWVTLASKSGSPPLTFTGIFEHTGLPFGYVSYQIRSYSNDIPRDSFLYETVTITDRISGTILFSTTIAPVASGWPTVTVWTVTVPAGLNLTLNDGVYWYGSSFCVSGTVTRAPGARQGDFVFYSPQTMADQNEAHFDFQPGSDTSVINGGFDLNLYVSSFLTVRDVSNIYLGFIDGDGMRTNCPEIHFERCEVSGKLLPKEGTSLLAEDTCFSDEVHLSSGTVASVQFTGCTFLRPAYVQGDAPVFDTCEFCQGCLLVQRTGARFNNSVFIFGATLMTDPSWASASAPSPEFTGNSFVGQAAVVHSPDFVTPAPIAIGANYYGDAAGPRSNQTAFLTCRGSLVSGSPFLTLAAHQKTGKYQTSTKAFPRVWSCGMISGQNSLRHDGASYLVQGRETLICADLATTVEELPGVKVYAMMGSTKLWPTTGENVPVKLYRDPAKLGTARSQGASTINIIVPPHTNEDATFKLYIDTTGVSGYSTSGRVDEVDSVYEDYAAAPLRPLHVCVTPVAIDVWGYTRGVPGNIPQWAERFKHRLAASMPIASQNIELWIQDPTTYSANLNFWWHTSVVADMGRTLWCERQFLYGLGALRWTPDFTLPVVRANNLGAGTFGQRSPAAPRTCFSDERMPEAAIHEIGHALGLYPSNEEYHQYPPNGIVVSNMTAFINEDNVSIRSFISGGIAPGRITHFPGAAAQWNAPAAYGRVTDLMGNSSLLWWPVLSSILPFYSYFASELLNTNSAKHAPRDIAVFNSPPSNGMMRIFLWGRTEPHLGYRRFVNGSIRAMDITPYSVAAVPPVVPAYGGHGWTYNLYAYDRYETFLYSQRFETHTNDLNPEGITNGIWAATFDFPSNAARYVVNDNSSGAIIFEARGSDAITNAMTAPVADATLGETVTVSWNAVATNYNAWQPYQPLQHLVLKSADDGTNWVATGLFSDATSLTLPTYGFTARDHAAFRVVSCDGVRSAVTQIGGLVVSNRGPGVTIFEPMDGTHVDTNVPVSFAAEAYDVEEGFLTNGVWWSSRDGYLGTGACIPARTLAEGTTLISFAAADADGCAATATALCIAGPMASIDLAIGSNALSIATATFNVPGAAPAVLQTGVTHCLSLGVRNTGCESAFTLQLYVQPPSGPELLLASETVSNVEPFAETTIEAGLVPVDKGDYGFRGVITTCAPPDGAVADNERTWTFSSRLPALIAADHDALDFGSVGVGTPVQRTLVVSNAGEQDLLLGTLSITGDAAHVFVLSNDTCSGATIGPGLSRTVAVCFTPGAEAVCAAALFVPSSDATYPEGLMPLHGVGVPEPAVLAIGCWLVVVRRRVRRGIHSQWKAGSTQHGLRLFRKSGIMQA